MTADSKQASMQAKNSSSIASSVTRAKGLIQSFHKDERGLKVVEMLLIIFVAAIILIGFLKIFFPEVLQKVKGKVMELLGMEVTG